MTKGIVSFGPAESPAGPNTKRTLPYFLLTLCLCAFVPLCLIFFLLPSASGYVLPGQHLLLLMTESLGSANSLQVHQKTFLYDGIAPEPQTELTETLSYRFSNAFRSDCASPDLTRIHVDTLDAMVTVLDGHQALQNESRFDRYKDLLLFHSRILLQERLFSRDIDTMVSSLGRFDGVPVYVLGAQYPDMTTAQVWIEKETFHPLRLLIPITDGEGGVSILEFRYLLWQMTRKLWYPMKIECYEGGKLLREMVVEDLVVNPAIADNDFDIGLLKSHYGEEVYTDEDPEAPDVRSDIQKAIEDFKKRYE